jgi:hypothetical protein
VNVERYYEDDESTAYTYGIAPYGSQTRAYVGRKDSERGYTNAFRMAYKFDLSQVPSDAYVLSVKLFANITPHGTQGVSFTQYNIREFSSISFNSSYNQIWSACGSGGIVANGSVDHNYAQYKNYEIASYGVNESLTYEVQQHLGFDYYLAIQSNDEDISSEDDMTQYLDFQYDDNNETFVPGSSFWIEVKYTQDRHVVFSNSFDEMDPLAWDFKIDNVERAHGHDEYWVPNVSHDIEMNWHGENILHSDGRGYVREPEMWEKEQSTGTTDNGGGATWTTSVYSEAQFTAYHYRQVENQFRTVYEQSGAEMSGIPFTVDGAQWSTGGVKTTRNGVNYTYSAVYPFTYTDISTSIDYYLVCLRNIEYGSYINGTVTNSIIPDEHHRDIDGNGVKAEYQNFMFINEESGQPITSAAVNIISVNSSDNSLTFSVPLLIQIAGIDYYFVGWDDGEIGQIDHGLGLVTRTLYLGNDTYDYAAAMRGRYKAHLVSNATFSYAHSDCGTCPNSQRKMDWISAQKGRPYSADGMYQAVYESSNRIGSSGKVVG